MILHEIILVIIGIGLFTLMNDEILALKNFTRGDKNNFAGPQKGPGECGNGAAGGIFANWRDFCKLTGFLQVDGISAYWHDAKIAPAAPFLHSLFDEI